jgi:hypothetical protein
MDFTILVLDPKSGESRIHAAELYLKSVIDVSVVEEPEKKHRY